VEQEGPELLEAVEAVRGLARRARERGGRADRDELARLVASWMTGAGSRCCARLVCISSLRILLSSIIASGGGGPRYVRVLQGGSRSRGVLNGLLGRACRVRSWRGFRGVCRLGLC
jgi:hypothetical protein